MLLQARNVTRRFGGVPLFENLTVSVRPGARIGLVGRNGTGKSTLLKIIAGIEQPDAGEVSVQSGVTIGFLDQHTGLESTRTIWDEMVTVFEPLLEMEEQMRQLEHQLAKADRLTDQEYERTLKKYHHLQEDFDRQNGYSYVSEIKRILHGFNFPPEMFDRPIKQLSGGQKTRLALAKLLLEQNNVLILDEPTNHLDIETLQWLENYLESYRGALIIVSHDRYFLDQLVNEIYELDYLGVMNHYHGNYTHYLKERAARVEKQWKEYEKQQAEIERLEDFVQKNIVRASTSKRAQSRRKKLDKMDRLERPSGDEKSPFFSFRTARTSGEVVLQTSDLAVGYDERPLIDHITLDVRRQEMIALVGPNGSGKSTFLKTLIGQLPKLAGDIHFGSKVDIGYYDQEQRNLTPANTVLNEIWDAHPQEDEETIRTFLGSFLFSDDTVQKTVRSLSGGERARLLLAKLALAENNFLLMDEPTNHLDIDAKEVLENALIDFEGTLLFVSHDRYFINKMATQVLEIDEHELTLYLGDYDYYLQKKEETQAFKEDTAASVEETAPESPSTLALSREAQKERDRNVRRLNRQIEQIEKKLEIIVEKVSTLEQALADPLLYDDPEKAAATTQDHQAAVTDQDKLLKEWEEAQLELLEFDEDS